MPFLKKDLGKTMFEIQTTFLSTEVSNVHMSLLQDWLDISDSLGVNSSTSRSIFSLISHIDFLKKNIRMFITHYTLPAFEAGIVTAFSRKEIEQKKILVLKWLDKLLDSAICLQKSQLDAVNSRNILHELRNQLIDIKDLTDLKNALYMISSEYAISFATSKRVNILFDALSLQSNIRTVSKKSFALGDYNTAVLKAFKEIELLVKKKVKRKELYTTKLMSEAFSDQHPLLRFSSDDEQAGYRFLFMGAMLGIRNVEAHTAAQKLDPLRALEFLSFASLLARKLDEAEELRIN
jgi:uncharacterized protein (TIGR02391 family)